VSLLVVGIETGTIREKGAAGRGLGRMKQRKTRREVVRRDVVDVVLSPPRIDLVVLPDVDPTRTSPTVLLDAAPIPMREWIERTYHTVLLDVLDVLTDLVHHAVAHIPLVIPLPPKHPLLSHPRWTSILRNRTILA